MGRCCTREQTYATPIGDYLREIRNHDLLSAEEEVELARAIQNGDDVARTRLIGANLRLVVKVARDFEGRGLALDDLVGEGNVGLIKATEAFDPKFGTRFSTYASHWIKQAIRHALITTTATIRLPAHMVGLLTKWRRAERHHLREFGQPASFEELVVTLGLSDAKCRMVEKALIACRLMPVGGDRDEGDTLNETTDFRETPDASLEADDDRRDLMQRLKRLDDRERTILTLRYGLGDHDAMTLKQIGLRLGVTREWVRKIEVRAVRKLNDDWNPRPSRPGRRARASRSRSQRSPSLQLA
ncbi:sigma-70 family RNA polymerase sigma factor [Tautonia rosea]|uniref:sigma-70 family RNA polymerase sigma factor n=1 Tax=Tautonia rosea TaxID=2728037 RepID=UPI001475A2C2|nr:RNA polymerase sigma factor RpoD/SigA [Tautonia rosea]